MTPDRLEKLNTIGFVWSVRGEISTSPTEKNTTNPLADDKGESTTISVVDAVMPKTEEEEKFVKKEEKDDPVTADAPVVDRDKDVVSVNV